MIYQNETEPAFKARNVKYDAPHGWTPTKIRGKSEWRCGWVQYVFQSNELRRCSHACEKRNIIFHHDRHIFEIPQKDDPDFPKAILSRLKKDNHNSFNRRYTKYLAKLCGQIDISCQKGASQPMRDFSINLLNEGYQLGKVDGKKEINIPQYLNKVSEKEISREIVHQSHIQFDKDLEEFKGQKFSCLICDAGTVMRSHCLHFMLVCYSQPIKKILLDVFDGPVFDSKYYSACFTNILSQLQENNIEVCAITTDSLPAQVKGWSSFQDSSDDPNIKALFRIPCFAHMINLVFLNAMKKSPNLKSVVSKILEIMKIARSRECVQFINASCPSYSRIRWLFIVDVLLFLLDKRNEINNFIQISNVSEDPDCLMIDKDIEFAYKVLVQLKMFSLNVEKSRFHLFNIVPLAREFFEELKKLYTNINDQKWREIISIIDALMRLKLKHNALEITITSYALSSVGRAELRKKYAGIRTVMPYTLSFTTPCESIYIERTKFEKKKIPLFTEEFQEEEETVVESSKASIEQDEDDLVQEMEDQEDYFNEDENELLEKELNNQDLIISQKMNGEFILIMKTPYEERVKQDIFKDIYHISQTTLIHFGSILGIDEEYIEQKFDEFLFADPLSLDFMKYSFELPYVFWKKVFCYSEEWEIFSELALRFSCAFTSESMVERLLSVQRCIQNGRMSNVSTATLKARLQLHEPTIKED